MSAAPSDAATNSSSLPSGITAPDEPQARFPTIPVLIYLGVVILTTVFLVVPPLLRDAETSASADAMWMGRTFAGRCDILVYTQNSADPMARPSREYIPSDTTLLLFYFDNRQGIRPVTANLGETRLYNYTGRSRGRIPPGEANVIPPLRETIAGNETLTFPAGADPVVVAVPFPKDAIESQIDRLYAVQFKADGELYNLQGVYLRNLADLQENLRDILDRHRLLPDPMPKEPSAERVSGEGGKTP